MSARNTPALPGGLPSIGKPARAALLGAGINSLADVAEWSERDLLALHGVGPKAVRLLGEALTEAQMTFATARSGSTA